MLYPQNGDRIVAIDCVTSLHSLYMRRIVAAETRTKSTIRLKQSCYTVLQTEVARSHYEYNHASMQEGLRAQQENQKMTNDRASVVKKVVEQVYHHC